MVEENSTEKGMPILPFFYWLYAGTLKTFSHIVLVGIIGGSGLYHLDNLTPV